jgi:ribosomal protein L16 Arg81 hydroxylase
MAGWRQWITQNLLRGCSEASMVDAMVSAGIDRPNAAREVEAAVAHPYVRAAIAFLKTSAPAPGSDAKTQKREWVLECYRRLARQSDQQRSVPRVPRLSRREFLEQYYAVNRPVVMTGAMDDWPAMTRWTNDELRRRFGGRTVSVQTGRDADANYERNSPQHRTEMRFDDFIALTESGESNDCYITANNSEQNKEALKELWEDIIPFPEYLSGEDPGNRSFFWFGPKGTVTPLHHDLTNNFMAMVRGRKLVRLVAPYELVDLYNDRHCFSQVDLERIDYDAFPAFRNVKVIEVEIGPGDLLFVPVGWWHHVRGLEASITMTFTNFVFDNDFYSFYKTYEGI